MIWFFRVPHVKSNVVILVVAALALAGCSRGLLGGGSSAPSAEPQIAVNNDLALPPDLSLRAPGTARAAAPAAPAADTALYDDEGSVPSTAGALPKGTQGDVYEKYGISKLKPDGTKKSDWELRQELRAAVLAEKRKKNPRYGTIFNAGELFSDDQ
jgi:hypothetical protein